MSDEQAVSLRGTDGQVHKFDEYNHTVVLPDGRKVDFTEYDPSNEHQRDFTQANVHVAAALTNFAIDYGSNQSEAIADMAAPVVLVDKASDTYHTYSKQNKLRRVTALLTSEDAGIPEVGPVKSTDTYNTKPYGLSTFIGQGVEANADPGVNPRLRAMARIMNAMVMEREHRCATALMNATTFSGYTTALTSSNYWDGGASSDPVKDIYTAQESTLKNPNRMILSQKGWNRFVSNEQIAKHAIYVGEALSKSPQALMASLGFPEIMPLIGSMKSESQTAGTTTESYIWDDDCLFAYMPIGNSIEDVLTARTFRWLKGGMSRESGGYRIREWDEPNRGQDGGRRLAVVTNEVIKVTAADTGYLYTNVY